MDGQKLNLTEIEKIPLEPKEFIKNFGSALIVAPHADDESLGCGGAVALLRKYGLRVSILLLSDGTLSHPNSKKFPAEKLRDLREKEMMQAAKVLGVEAENLTFFRFRDRSVPVENSANFAAAVERLRQLLTAQKPQTIFVPWRRDPHPDHRAAFQLVAAAKNERHQIIEYPVWLYELAAAEDAPRTSEVTAFRLDISSVVEIKQKAIDAHRSQTTDLIDDDPEGFRLSAEVLQNFAAPFELFLRDISNAEVGTK